MSKSKRDFTLSHTNYYFLQRTQPLEQHKPPAVNYILRDPQYFLHYFEDDERSAPHLPSVPSAFRERIGPRWASCRGRQGSPADQRFLQRYISFYRPSILIVLLQKNSFPKALHSKLLVEDMTHIQNCQSLSMELITFRIFSACK